MLTSEFQAVVLAAGKGSRFAEVTQQKAKCLLPIGHLPMIWYPLHMLQKVGFQEVIVVTHEQHKTEVSSLPKRFGLHLKLDVVSLSSLDDVGTADAVRLVHDRLTSPRILLVSSDLVTTLPLHHLTDLHRVHGAAVTALFAKALDLKSVSVPGPKTKVKKEKDVVGVDRDTHRLCYLSSMADLEEEVCLRRSLLAQHAKMGMYSNLMDAHLYVLDKWVCDFLKEDTGIASIKGELIPLLVKKQFSKTKKDATKIEQDTPNPKAIKEQHTDDFLSFMPMDEMSDRAQKLSCWNDHVGDLEEAYHGKKLRCFAYIMDGGSCLRANNLYSYCELNRQAPGLVTALAPERQQQQIHPESKIQPRATVGPECLVGESTYISDKTTTKSSTLGHHCMVEEKVRITNCIVMDNVTVKEGANVTGSLLCDGAVIGERCEVKDCIVGKGFSFAAGSKHTNEILVQELKQMMEI